MTSVSSDQAGERIEALIEQVVQSHEPLQIQGQDNVAVLIAEQDWRAVQETLHLLAIPGMRESIREGLSTPTEACSEDPGW